MKNNMTIIGKVLSEENTQSTLGAHFGWRFNWR